MAEKTAKKETIEIISDYNFWDAKGVKHPKGVAVEVDSDTAKALIKEKKAIRAEDA